MTVREVRKLRNRGGKDLGRFSKRTTYPYVTAVGPVAERQRPTGYTASVAVFGRTFNGSKA
jgi:hypothetical protein